MRKHSALSVLALLLIIGTARPGISDIESILGKWLLKAETPNGPLELQLELKQDGSQLVGIIGTMQGNIPLSALKFQEPNLAAELTLGGMNYKLQGVLKDGKFDGSWEMIGGDVKGTWTAQRQVEPATVPAAAGLSGTWTSTAATPNGDLVAALELKQEGDKITGSFGSDMGTIPIQAASFKDNRLQFDVELGGAVYRVEGVLKENKIEGKWYPAAGGEGGAWNATRKLASTASASASSSAPTAAAGIEGAWDAVAVSPDGSLNFLLEIKKSSEGLTGRIVTPDGNLSVRKLGFDSSKLSFEVDYMGGTYRLEGTLSGDKLAGKWSAVNGTDTGDWSAVRKQ